MVTIAFSGGADSLALLSLLSSALPGKVEAVYVDHNIRSRDELDREIELNRRNADLLGVPLTVLSLAEGEVYSYAEDGSTTLEAAARTLRYKLLLENTDGFIATAHTASDQAETLMMRLISGCSFRSLAGIRAVNGRIVRPMLLFTRAESEEVCRNAGLIWSDDSTNEELFCYRNRVRHLVASELGSATFLSLNRIASNVSAFLERLPAIEVEEHSHYISFDRSAFLSSHPAAAEEVLNSSHDFYSDSRLSDGQRAEITASIEKRRGYEAREYYLECTTNEVRIYPRACFFVTSFDDPHFPMSLSAVSSDDPLALRIDRSLIRGKAIYRLAVDADEIELKEHKVSVKSLLSSYHVPYAVVLEDQEGIIAFFARAFGGRDRLARRFLSSSDAETSLMLV